MSAAGTTLGNVERAAGDRECWELFSETFHELSQPLSTITCLLEVSLAERLPRQSRHNLQIALRQVQSTVRLFGALRELARVRNPDATSTRTTLSLNVCVRDVVEDLAPVAESAGAKFSMASQSDCLVSVRASALRQAVFQLLAYAIDSCGVNANINVTVGETYREAIVEITVSRGESESKAPHPGTPEMAEWKRHKLEQRLGLAIAARIFENDGGSLRSEDDGSRLTLAMRLPLARTAE